MATLTVNVTQEDIDAGVAKDCRRCPVAKALARALNSVVAHASDNILASLTLIGGRFYCDQIVPAPPVVADFVRRFDAGQPISPFTFPIDWPSPTQGATPCSWT
jgi:hypothetical protein